MDAARKRTCRPRQQIVLACLGVVLAGCGPSASRLAQVGAAAAQAQDPNDPAVRILASETRLKAGPTPALHAELGAAYLDMARATFDVAWLAKARSQLERSLALSPSANAYVTLAALCNFAQRYPCALENAERAARLDPRDARTRELRIEAYLGLGELKRAEQLLAQPGREDGSAFALAASRGRCMAEQERYDDALRDFVSAAGQARSAGDDALALRAELQAAGALIDSGRPGLARRHLEAGMQLLPASWSLDAQLQTHWGEVHELERRPAEALRAYETVLAHRKDPEIYRRAYTLARRLGDTRRADELFSAAETSAERILAAGESFALEAQARLYADAGVKLERAEELAKQNLEHKRDRRAYATLAYVRQQRAAEVK